MTMLIIINILIPCYTVKGWVLVWGVLCLTTYAQQTHSLSPKRFSVSELFVIIIFIIITIIVAVIITIIIIVVIKMMIIKLRVVKITIVVLFWKLY